MAKKKEVKLENGGKGILFIILLGLLVIGTIVLIVLKNNDRTTTLPEKKECLPFTGGGFDLIYETNGGEELQSEHVCIACSPDSYASIVTPKREGYKFEGWYYDSEFEKPFEGKSTLDITPVSKFEEGCNVGYKDIVLYAKWEK